MVKRVAVLVFLLAVVLSACSSEVEPTIVGAWKGETIQQDFRFYDDGRIELNDRDNSQYRGTYTITEGNVMTCQFESSIFTSPVVRTVEIKGEKLILTDNRGTEEIYVR
ncbi:MAG: DUF5640 domain-containing protein [Candidatus Krumholzibacteria bacterium]|nr:DUF5640 domain-containing protein [Candidatus Krumholzibacteria bacterium]